MHHARTLAIVTGIITVGFLSVLLTRYRSRWRWSIALGGIALGAYGLSRGPLYSPLDVLGWTIRYHHIQEATPVLQTAAWIFAVTLSLAMTVMLAATRAASGSSHSVSHGSARWGTGESLRYPQGLIVGTLDKEVLRYRGDGHLVTVAPTRSGKGVSVIIPNLLSYPGSVIVTDPKGENYAVTARRRRELGTTVHAFDPFDVVGGTAAFNPLDVIQPTSVDAIDDARLLADMLVVVEGKETGEQSFWNEEARALLTGLILYVVAHEPPERRTLTHLRALLTLPPTLWSEFLTRMSASTAVNGLVARAAARILQKAEKERSGVISSAQSQTHFLDSPRMARVLHQSTVDFATLKRGRLSCLVILPPDRLETYQRWLRP